QITFSATHGWSAFWRGRPWLAGRRIGETSSDVGSSRFWIGWVTKHGDKCARSTCPGLIGPGDRKSVQPMAKRLALGACDQLHHFIAAGVWDATPVETELLVQADRLVIVPSYNIVWRAPPPPRAETGALPRDDHSGRLDITGPITEGRVLIKSRLVIAT